MTYVRNDASARLSPFRLREWALALIGLSTCFMSGDASPARAPRENPVRINVERDAIARPDPNLL